MTHPPPKGPAATMSFRSIEADMGKRGICACGTEPETAEGYLYAANASLKFGLICLTKDAT